MPSRVLVVDDDPVICELIQEVLSSADMESLTLTSSSQAASHLGTEKFAAIFLDVHMPSPNGIELTQQIRASRLNRTTPVAIITGEGDNTVLGRAFKAGASFFLFKPIDRHRVLRLLRVSADSIQRERRRFQRVRVTCKVSIESESERLSGTTLDLSLNGLFVETSRALPLGSAVRVSVELRPGTPPLRVAARVVRVLGDKRMGLQIENAGPAETKRFQEFLVPLILADVS